MNREASRTFTLITGASTGIGAELARVFASRGHSIILVARSENRLRDRCKELSTQFPITAHYFVSDLRLKDQRTALLEWVNNQNIEVNTLVNNAGLGWFGNFSDCSWDRNADMISLNIEALTHLTHLFLPGMLRVNSGRILQVASIAGFQPGPLMAVYYATKAYVLSFSEALAEELQGSGVNISVLCPGPTQSEFFDVAGLQQSRLFKTMAVQPARDVAEYAYRSLMANKTIAVHGLLGTIAAQTHRVLPRWLMRKVIRVVQEKIKPGKNT